MNKDKWPRILEDPEWKAYFELWETISHSQADVRMKQGAVGIEAIIREEITQGLAWQERQGYAPTAAYQEYLAYAEARERAEARYWAERARLLDGLTDALEKMHRAARGT